MMVPGPNQTAGGLGPGCPLCPHPELTAHSQSKKDRGKQPSALAASGLKPPELPSWWLCPSQSPSTPHQLQGGWVGLFLGYLGSCLSTRIYQNKHSTYEEIMWARGRRGHVG